MFVYYLLVLWHFLTQIIRLRVKFLDYTIKKVRLDNADEFTSQAFNHYCMSIRITVEHMYIHVHTENNLTESLISVCSLLLVH